jgi:hypothetical protein
VDLWYQKIDLPCPTHNVTVIQIGQVSTAMVSKERQHYLWEDYYRDLVCMNDFACTSVFDNGKCDKSARTQQRKNMNCQAISKIIRSH